MYNLLSYKCVALRIPIALREQLWLGPVVGRLEVISFLSWLPIKMRTCVLPGTGPARYCKDKLIDSICYSRKIVTDTEPRPWKLSGKKVKQSQYGPGQALRVSGIWGSRISRQLAHEDGKVVNPTHRPPLHSRKYSWYSFLLEDESIPGP